LLTREFVQVAEVKNGHKTVTLLQMNVLADWLCHDDFPEKSRDLIHFDYRKSRLLKVVLENSPDVIAIEECDHFADWFQPELAKAGYDGTFQAKSDKDGTAIFCQLSNLKEQIISIIVMVVIVKEWSCWS